MAWIPDSAKETRMAGRERAMEALLREERRFPPPELFREHANASDAGIYERAAADPEGFWAEWAQDLDWFEPWERVLDWRAPHARWWRTTAWTGIFAVPGGTRRR
jgi:acetyl-CoA synthetase